MKSVLRMIIAGIRKNVINRRFLVCVLGVAVLLILDVFPGFLHSVSVDESGKLHFGGSIIQLMGLQGYTLYQVMSLSVCVLGAACVYCMDAKANAMNQLLIRSSYWKYTVSSVAVSAITGFLCMVLAELLMLAVYGSVLPLHYEVEAVYDVSGYPLLRSRHYYLHIASDIVLNGLRGAFFSIVTFLISAFVKNQFVIVASPMIVFFIFMRFGYMYFPPEFDIINVKNVYYTYVWIEEGVSLLYTLGYTLLVAVICGIIFYKRLRRIC